MYKGEGEGFQEGMTAEPSRRAGTSQRVTTGLTDSGDRMYCPHQHTSSRAENSSQTYAVAAMDGVALVAVADRVTEEKEAIGGVVLTDDELITCRRQCTHATTGLDTPLH
jgi:hypothetical protein